MKTMGEKLKEVRISLYLTQKQLADILTIKQNMLSAIEIDKRKLREVYIKRLETECFVNPEYFKNENAEMFLPHYSELNDRILKICEEYKIHTPHDLSINTGLDIEITGDIFKLKKPPPQYVIGVLQQSFPDVSEEWIKTGKGRMFYSNPNEVSKVEEPKAEYSTNVINDLISIIKQQTEINKQHADNLTEIIRRTQYHYNDTENRKEVG